MAVRASGRDAVLKAAVETMEIDTFRIARPDDAEAIAQLVNQAFRPRTGAEGWTHEAHLVAGDRIDPAQVLRALVADDTALLLGMAGDAIVACVQVELTGNSARIGMLAVAPDRQGGGLGKAMLAQAEAHAVQRWQVEKFVMRVLSARVELLAFYLRRGYRRSGEVSDYPVSAAGVPLQAELKIETLEKDALGGVR
jgi:ribosomal protein S18 acetylase RimI-like enzyme